MDGAGNFCGVTKGYEDYPDLYMTTLLPSPTAVSPVNYLFKAGVCVKRCPTKQDGNIVIDCAKNARFETGGTCANIYDY